MRVQCRGDRELARNNFERRLKESTTLPVVGDAMTWFAVPVTLVTVPPKEESELNEGGALLPLGFPYTVPAGALSSANVGVVVGFVTLNSGVNPLTLVTVPAPPLSTNHVHGGKPVCMHTCKRLSVRLRYETPGNPPVTSASVYARRSSGTVRLSIDAAGQWTQRCPASRL